MDIKELLGDAQRFFLEGKYKESVEVFTKIIDAGEHTEIACLSRGAAYFKMNEYDNAVKDFGAVTGLNDQNYRAYYYRGIALLAKEEYEKAIADFDRVIKLKPDHGAAFFGRGTAYAHRGNEEEATKSIRTALTYSEAVAQGFADTAGIFRTQFDKAMAMMKGKESSMQLTEEETKELRKLLEE
ncbi:MAG TPA: tetratricopeptide repeat protein [Nitrospirae bacterium]|nr:lipoprotein NlpI [bacterium BMS3Abin10]GBE38973.1 lipoprotein NlpI [bacterium BMS3Bbin08]HDH51167.1 tetratricopeptide repeat protein [Nitrospirota bacterium]HDK17403.1 tetratricopeptide repeat protein [Nitrospirota bacterium]HDK81051.1 tetratricopeptide repeat protein [Nitrospirota bacterium]